MLPSTGKFKEISCPFFDSGLCERPYCHFRHVKRDTSEVIQTPVSTVSSTNPALALGENGEILHQLVSEAVRKVLEQTDLPSALGRPSASNAMENVSRNLATKVAEVLVPPVTSSASSQQTFDVPTTSQKVPSYKPTPISVLKNRHIPIPYSPSLSKSYSVLRKRTSSNEYNNQKKFKKQGLENANTTPPTYASNLITSKVYDPTSVSGIDCKGPENPSDIAQYSPTPMKGWKDNGFKYTPSSIETLIQNTYVPSSSQTAQITVAEYEPTEKLESFKEPSYEPLATNGSTSVGAASYEPSRVSNLEPEYQPLCCDNTTKEYVPTNISKLGSICSVDVDISPEIDLLHDLLHDELNENDEHSENTGKEKTSDASKLNSHSGSVKHSSCDRKSLNEVEKPKKNHERHQSNGSKKKTESDKRKSDVERKNGDNVIRKESSKKKSDSKKSSEISSISSNNNCKNRTDTEKKRDDNDKKKDHCDKKRDDHKKRDDGDKKREDVYKKRDVGDKKRDDSYKKRDDDDDKRRDDGHKKRDDGHKKKDEGDKKRDVVYKNRDDGDKKRDDCNKKRYDDVKKGDDDIKKRDDGDKKRCEGDKKRDDGDKKRNESQKKNDNKESERKQKDEKRSSSEIKHGEQHDKKFAADKKSGETEKKKSETEVKKSEIDKKKHVSRKDSSTEKHTTNTRNYKHSDKNFSVIRERKNGERHSICGSSEHSHSSRKSDSEKKCDECKKNAHNHKINVSGHSSDKHQNLHVEGKRSKSDEHPKLKSNSSKRTKSNSDDRVDPRKFKSSHKKLKSDAKTDEHPFSDESNVDAMSDSEEDSLSSLLDNVILPDDSYISTSDEDSVTKECYRIFQEYKPRAREKALISQSSSVEEDERPLPGKQRIAHQSALSRVRSPVKRLLTPDPSKVLSERLQKVLEYRAQVNAQALAIPDTPAEAQDKGQSKMMALESNSFLPQSIARARAHSSGSPPSSLLPKTPDIRSPPGPSAGPFAGARKRIAHVPNVSVFLDAKVKMQQKLKEQQLNVELSSKGSSTTAQTVQKGSQRIAHMPVDQVLSRPVVKGIGGRIPSNVRQSYLDILVDEYLKVSASEQEAFEKAEEEERTMCAKSSTRGLYASHISNAVTRIRKMAPNTSASSSDKMDPRCVTRTISHLSMLAGKIGSKGSWSIEKPRKPTINTNKSLYAALSQFILTEEELKQNGFPLSHEEEKGTAVIHNFYKKPFIPRTPNQRMCARCSKIYYVSLSEHIIKEQCIYHWGRLFQTKTLGSWEARYNCCQGHGEAVGCSVGSCHVSDNFDPNNLRGFVKTLPKDVAPPDGDYGIYALDCEMCYTTVGLELTRVTVIGRDLQVVYETLVKPMATILDYNTRFSGIKEEDLADVTTNIYEVQSVLLSLVNQKTILIGHSLESDFKALKLIHGTVVDTSVVYPHKMGPPKKRALKTLCRDLLHKIIQESEGGHDSAEDARAAMEVMLFKVKEDLKTW